LIFHEARVILVNKIDLLPYTDFSLDKFNEDIAQINPSAVVFMVSGRTGEGIEDWIYWLLEEVKKKRP
jgi:hydrogenase nickel incorporation protein HypB